MDFTIHSNSPKHRGSWFMLTEYTEKTFPIKQIRITCYEKSPTFKNLKPRCSYDNSSNATQAYIDIKIPGLESNAAAAGLFKVSSSPVFLPAPLQTGLQTHETTAQGCTHTGWVSLYSQLHSTTCISSKGQNESS